MEIVASLSSPGVCRKRRTCRGIQACVLVVALGACGSESPGTPDEGSTDVGVGTPADLEAPAVPQAPTVADDAPPVELLALTGAQLKGTDLHGELACAFADAELGTLLVARADVRPDGAVHGLMSNGGYTELLANLEAGGFDDLADGITLAGKALTVRLVRGAAEPTGEESTRHVATLNVDPAEGPSRTYTGTLTCGP